VRILLSWLREFVDVPESAEALADILSMRGFALEGLEPAPAGCAPGDAVLDVEVTANRPDCLSVTGIAREVATALDRPLRLPGPGQPPPLQTRPLEVGDDRDLTVAIDDPDRCPRFGAAVADVRIGPSPEWMVARLTAADVRPINNVVDITNYVLLELGQPMHAYDLDRLSGRRLRARCATEAERVRTLDGEVRRADPDMLVIADDAQPQGFGGVMGGADSEVTERTRVIVFEAAHFKPTSVRQTSKRLGLKTEASARFERGADIAAPMLALERACALLEQVGAGQARGRAIDCYPAARAPIQVTLRRSRVTRLLGLEVDDATIVRILSGLGFSLHPGHAPGTWQVEVPTRRVDVSREADLIEEIARHHGYDRVPAAFPMLHNVPPPSDGRIERDRRLRRLMRAAGYSEAVTFTFIERAAVEDLVPDAGVVPIANPLSESFAILRPSLWPGLLASIAHNRRRARRDVRLFEIGSRFRSDVGESRVMAFAATGRVGSEHWSGTDRPLDFFDAKGLVEQLSTVLGVTVAFERTHRPELVDGRAARLTVSLDGAESVEVGLVGQLAPRVAEARDLPSGDDVYVGELDLDAVADASGAAVDRPTCQLPRFPSIVRDLSVLVPDTLPAEALRGTIHAAAPDTLSTVAVFDRYQGQGIPDRSVSLSFRLTYRSLDRTLTDDEVEQAMSGIVSALERTHGAERR